MDSLRVFCRSLLLVIMLSVPAVVSAQSRTAEAFVSNLVAVEDQSQMLSLIANDADVAYLMTTSLGDRFQQMDEGQLKRFADGFREMLAQQALVVASQARGGQFRAGREQRTADGVVVSGEVSVQTQSLRNPNGVFEVQLLIRQDQSSGREKIADLLIGDRWASAHFADAVDQLFEMASGDVEQVVMAIEPSQVNEN